MALTLRMGGRWTRWPFASPNALAYDLSNRIGRYAPRTRFAEAYLVDDGGDVRADHFHGFVTLIEKIERASSA